MFCNDLSLFLEHKTTTGKRMIDEEKRGSLHIAL